MAPTHLPLRDRAILFGHRGSSAHERPDTVAAYALALRLGATGIRSDAWSTRDGVAVLTPGTGRLRRRRIAAVERSELRPEIPSLDDLYGTCGSALQVWVDVRDPAAVDPLLDAARRAGREAVGRLWIAHGDLATLVEARRRADDAHLVLSTRVDAIDDGLERCSARLRDEGIAGLALPRTDWTAGRTTLVHRFGRAALSGDAPHERMIVELLNMGIDGVSSAHADRLADAARQVG